MNSTDATPAIKINNLCKTYKIYRRTTDLLFEALGGKRPPEFVALDNVSLEVRPGETVGIIGRNGAGKSTLLRILAGTLDKTSGSVEVNGRISAILELGTGFHPDYSGRDNIVYGGLCMGLTRKEIQERQTQIIAFSELEKFIDQPLRTYSTGMQARLAFATTVCTNPDILIVDEALGVGDIKFQSKCFARMQEFRRARKSILLVSHDLNAITSFCDRAILLESGKILEIGKPLTVTRRYYDLLYGANNEPPSQNCPQESPSPVEADDKSSPVANANKSSGVPGFVKITDYGILAPDGRRTNRLTSGNSYTIFIEARFIKKVVNPLFGILIRDEKGVALFGTDTHLAGLDLPVCMPDEVLRIELEVAMWLAGGHFLLSPGVGEVEGRTFTALLDACEFEVEQPSQLHTYSIVNLGHAFMMQRKDDFDGQRHLLVEKKNTPREPL